MAVDVFSTGEVSSGYSRAFSSETGSYKLLAGTIIGKPDSKVLSRPMASSNSTLNGMFWQ